jgi:hypothetical protein
LLSLLNFLNVGIYRPLEKALTADRDVGGAASFRGRKTAVGRFKSPKDADTTLALVKSTPTPATGWPEKSKEGRFFGIWRNTWMSATLQLDRAGWSLRKLVESVDHNYQHLFIGILNMVSTLFYFKLHSSQFKLFNTQIPSHSQSINSLDGCSVAFPGNINNRFLMHCISCDIVLPAHCCNLL